MPKSEKAADIILLIELAKKSKAEGGSGKLSDQIIKVVSDMQSDLENDKLESEKLFQNIAKIANSIMVALLDKYVEDHSDPENYKQAVKLIQDLNLALVKKEKLGLRIAVNHVADFKWQLLSREAAAKAREDAKALSESQSRTLISSKPSESDIMSQKVESLNRYCINELYPASASGVLLSSKLSDFTKRFIDISGNDIVNQFSLLRSLMMTQMNDMQQLIGHEKPENYKEIFLRGYHIISQLLVPTLQSVILNNPILKGEEAKKEIDAGLSLIRKGTSDFIDRPGKHFHMSDYDDISAGLGAIKNLIEKQVSKSLTADGSKPKSS